MGISEGKHHRVISEASTPGMTKGKTRIHTCVGCGHAHFIQKMQQKGTFNLGRCIAVGEVS